MISAVNFFQSGAAQACPIDLIQKGEFEAFLAGLSPLEQQLLANQQFKAEQGQVAQLVDEQGRLVRVVAGMSAQMAGQALAQAALVLPAGAYQLENPLPQADCLAWALAQYRYDRYRRQERVLKTLVLPEAECKALAAKVEAVFLVRDLINAPTSDMGPAQLAEATQMLAKIHGAHFQEWVGEALLEANFNAIHAVGRASAQAPRLVELTWGNASDPLISLVGKGVCFDSGGLDLKPAQAMRFMKKDMGGAAQVLGLAHWIMSEHLPVRLQLYIPAVENAVGPDAFRPGDVLRMRNGLTVEIDNTDAEGRLILADALVKAVEAKPSLLIDFSTLTGAARVAVGTEISALFSNDRQLARDLMDQGENTNDPVWQLPLYKPYEDLFKSTIADLANCSSSPYAGAITAALFLQRFIPECLSWAHFDVMAWNVAAKPGKPEGGEAMGVLATAAYLEGRFRG